ncbi:MAG: glycerophosphodiester phosphodiesterase, partial [Actinomycetales bacterium]|nr:glycerophosphodiester phosphodiesterase [Actinomycetales bacterium]
LTGFKRRDDGWSPDVESLIETARRIGADGVDVQASLEVIDESFVSSVREAGLEFHVWTVDDPEVARALIRFGVDSITTNHPGSIQESLQKSMQESMR